MNQIVVEYLPFDVDARVDPAAEVVRYLRVRNAERKKNSLGPDDKMNNALISVTGCPGIGKSSFLAYLAISPAYKEYCRELSDKPPIVAPMTFNSMMKMVNFEEDTTGLRILYGALMCMLPKLVVTETDPMLKWEEFKKQFWNFRSISALNAVRLLRQIYGEDRRVLVLVDELSKASKHAIGLDQAVMHGLGDLLDTDGECDVVVSSLSPQYINNLLTGSQRSIKYIILPPLLNSDVGKAACEAWASKVIEKAGEKLDDFVCNFLRASLLVASGHPRYIEKIIKSVFNNSEEEFQLSDNQDVVVT